MYNAFRKHCISPAGRPFFIAIHPLLTRPSMPERGEPNSMTDRRTRDEAFTAEEKSREPEVFFDRDAVFNQIAELSRTFLWQIDADGTLTYLSHAVESLLGYRPDELVGRARYRDLHPENVNSALIHETSARFGRKEPFRNVVNPIRTKNGTVLWFSANGVPLFDGEGNHCGYRGTNTDITEYKKMEERLHESERSYSAIVENSPLGIMLQDPHGTIAYANAAFARMLGVGPQDVAGRSYPDLVHPDDRTESLRRIERNLASNDPLPLRELRLVRPDGREIVVEATAAPIEREGRPFIISVFQDITERKRFERLLVAEAEELKRHQEAIVACMAILAEFRDRGTGEHIVRTKEYVRLLLERSGGETRYPPEHIPLLRQAAALHDIGKVGIPDMILLKPGKLTPAEFDIIKQHPRIGSSVLRSAAEILGEVPFVTYARQVTEFHHEKWDGSGYPNGLKGEEIPLVARIMAIADVYDALVTERPYKRPISHDEAVAVIAAGSGSHFDPRLVEVFLECADEFDAIARKNA